MSKRGCIIVSAYDNEGSISYPAAFDNTIGVFWNVNVRSVKEYFYINNSPLEILGYAGSQRLPWANNKFKNVGGSSFAAPYITAKVAEYQRQNNKITILKVKELLRNEAVNTYTLPEIAVINEQRNNVINVSKIKKAIVFPFNKEIHALIGNTDLLHFEINGLYDYKFSKNIGMTTDQLIYGEDINKLKIERFEQIDWNGDFDTIIVGHVKVINNIMQTDYLKNILEKCYIYKKNCYFFDDIRSYFLQIKKIEDNKNCVMNHFINDLHIANFPCGGYHKIAVPTMAVVGTSSRQGKFNIQLSLRRRFIGDGYNIGQVGTEPSSYLFGMDITISNGYENQYYDTSCSEILYMNESIFQMKNKELILLGTQSQLIPMQFGNLGFLTPHQQNMLIALEPDCTILCINCDDDEDYVRRTINVLVNYYLTTVIAIVIFPYPRQRDWNVNTQLSSRIKIKQEDELKQEIYNKFGISVFVNGKKKDMDELYKVCVSFFSGNN